MNELFEERTWYYSKRLRHLFKWGGLARKWQHEYPHLFSDHDLSLTRHGSAHLFFEWLASITFFHSMGYRSHHKYECDNDPEGQGTFRRLLGEAFSDRYLENCTGSPDLLVVSQDESDWFLCETKGPGDRIGIAQRRMAKLIYNHTKRKVVLLSFKAI